MPSLIDDVLCGSKAMPLYCVPPIRADCLWSKRQDKVVSRSASDLFELWFFAGSLPFSTLGQAALVKTTPKASLLGRMLRSRLTDLHQRAVSARPTPRNEFSVAAWVGPLKAIKGRRTPRLLSDPARKTGLRRGRQQTQPRWTMWLGS